LRVRTSVPRYSRARADPDRTRRASGVRGGLWLRLAQSFLLSGNSDDDHGAADGSLADEDPEETATLLLNLVSWTYRHLRRGHGWEPERARDGVLRIALDGVAAR